MWILGLTAGARAASGTGKAVGFRLANKAPDKAEGSGEGAGGPLGRVRAAVGHTRDAIRGAAGGGRDPVQTLRSGWRRQWQAPAALLGAAALSAGIAWGVATRPDPDLSGPLSRAEGLISRERYEEALGVLNADVLPYVGTPALGPERQGRYHLAVARAVHRWQAGLGFEHKSNLETVAREYRAAEAGGASLAPEDRLALAMTLLSMGQHAEALAVADQIPDAKRDLRLSVQRASVERRLRPSGPGRDPEGALSLLTRMLTDPALGVDERVWALGRQSDVMLERGFAHEVVTRLLRELPRVERVAGDEALGGLFLRLGRAYLALPEPVVDEAGKQLERAGRLLGEGSVDRPSVLLHLARVHELRGEIGEARELYFTVVTRHASSDVFGRALMGLGEMDAAQGAVDESLESYQQAAELVLLGAGEGGGRGEAGGLGAAELAASLLGRYRERMVEGDAERALRYAQIAESLFSEKDTPPEVLEALARGNRVLADRLLGGVGDGAVDVTPAALARVDPGTRREAQRLLVRAGYYYRRHADAFVVSDPVRYGASLWLSAESYDLAGDSDEAVSAFRQYVADLPSEARHPEARHRLGRALQARGDYGEAAQAFEGLLSEAREGINPNAGPWADSATVPLAECLLADEDPANDGRAAELLERVLSGELGGAESLHFREALLAAAGMHARRSEHVRAVERYEEILRRYPGGDGEHLTRFRLADAYRRLAEEKRAELDGVLRDGDRRALAADLRTWLTRAAGLFGEAITGIEAVPAARRTGLEDVCLRNAYFYRADCAFDMGDYRGAIGLYSQAKDRFARDPASLVAMVQVVNAYIRLDDPASARAANNRARLFFESLPDSVWEDPDLPMSRADWERWLDSMELLNARVAGAEGGGGVGGDER